MRKEIVQFDGGIAEQPVDLLDAVFAQGATGVGQTLSNGMDGQGGTGQDSERTVGERQDPLGVQVAVVQLGDEGNQMVFAKYVSGFSPSTLRGGNSYFVSNLLPVQVRSRTWGKKWSTIFESTDPSQVQIEYKELANGAFAVLIWIQIKSLTTIPYKKDEGIAETDTLRSNDHLKA